MTQKYKRVNSGDLITADFMNGLLEILESLEDKISGLAGGFVSEGKVVITSPRPSDKFKLQDELRIEGRNFGKPSENVVFLDNVVRVDQFKEGSDDTRLIIDKIPYVPNIPDEGRMVTLYVTNKNGYATTAFVLAQPEILKPTGKLLVSLYEAPAVAKIEASKSYVYTYKVSASVTANEEYDLIPAVNLKWKAIIVDAAGNEIKPAELFIPKSDPPTVPVIRYAHVKVTIPANAPSGTTGRLSLTVISQSNPNELYGSLPEDTEIKVEHEPATANKIPITLEGVKSPGYKWEYEPGKFRIIVVEKDKEVKATFRVEVPKARNYKLTQPTFAPNPNGLWTGHIVGDAQPYMNPPAEFFTVSLSRAEGSLPTYMTLHIDSSDAPVTSGDLKQEIVTTIPPH